MTPNQIVAALGLLLSPEPDPGFDTLRQGGFDPRYPVTVEVCPETISPLDVDGQSILCGTVSVPEDYGKPDGRRVPLEFFLGRSLSTNPFPDAVVYLHGGPASGSLDIIRAVTDVLFDGQRDFRDVVSFDQRAAMLSSSTVRCYDAMAENMVGIVRALKNASPPEGEEPFEVASIYKPCVEELYASGADLAQYNTANNARDVRAVMSALGYPTYNIFGISYGTRLALEVLRTAPEGVRAVIIDGVAPPTARIYDELFPPHADSIEALFDQCAADAACAEAYPDLRAKFIELGDRLTENPIPGARGRPPLTADTVYTVLNQRTYQSARRVRDLNDYLPRIIYELVDGDTTTFDWYLDSHDGGEPDPDEILGGGASLSGDERALARTVLELAQALTDQTQGIEAALAQLKHDLVTGATAVSVAEAFDLRATEALKAMTQTEIASAIQDYALFQAGDPSRSTIAGWVETHFAGTDRAALLDLVRAMTERDIARTFEIADTDLAPYQGAVEGVMGLFIYACQEDIPYNSREGAAAVNADFAYSLIKTEESLKELADIYDTCDLFKPAPREGFHEPVASDVPVLAIGGTNDTQTSWKWSALAAETLTNARTIIFPNAGHGASLFSDCGRDINAKFILDPAAELDLSCVNGLLPKFVMPDDPLG